MAPEFSISNSKQRQLPIAGNAQPKKPNEIPQPEKGPETTPSEEPAPFTWPGKEPEIQPGKEPLTPPSTDPQEVPAPPDLISLTIAPKQLEWHDNYHVAGSTTITYH